MRLLRYLFRILFTLLGSAWPALATAGLFEIQVIEKGSGWPVPMVELKTTNHERFVSDNAGRIAFDLPEFMGREIWFDIWSPGYEVERDGFGNRGVRLTPKPGAKQTIEVERTMLAKRIGRVTGAGLFSESQKLGYENDWKESGLTGCDSVQNALHNGKLYWAWGDTNIARYPLGLFHMTGAVSIPRPLKSYEPPLKLEFEYFKNDQSRPRTICKMDGEGPTWLSGCVSLPDKSGKPRLVGCYNKIRNALETYRIGLCVWSEEQENFEHLATIWEDKPGALKKPGLLPEGQALLWTDEKGKQWVVFGDPLPRLRCAANFEAWSDPAQWEALNPQKSILSKEGKEVKPHRGGVAWNSYRKRWVTVFTQHFGEPSFLGELWYAEADTLFGKWGDAVKVLSHPDYSFYNPRLHPRFTEEGSPILLFEGTYTKQFSGTKVPTAKYDYNQILYRLDLDDPKISGGN